MTISDFAARREAAMAALTIAAEAGAPEEMTSRLRGTLNDACVDITLLGQIKSGKSSLANALIGRPGLLPVDVNPWTAAVTSLNVNQTGPEGVAARFEFFDEAGWHALAEGAGRLGALADRAGDAAELDRLRAQARDLQEGVKARLGRNYKMLLGGEHRHGAFDSALLARYIVLGDEADPTGAGRYAEITRRASLWLSASAWPLPVRLHDTPGVNDPLLVREEITLGALKDADVGVVVLNAAQALTANDVDLMRALLAMRGAETLIFVNRIDDLADPTAEVPAIRNGLRMSLRRAGLDDRIRILFGSALWAGCDTDEALPEHSRDAYRRYARAHGVCSPDEASGVRRLREEILAIGAVGDGRRRLEDAISELANWIADRRAAMSREPAALARRMERLEALMADASRRMERVLADGEAQVCAGMESALEGFASREAAALKAKIEAGGKGGWKCDVSALRAELARMHHAGTRAASSDLRGFWKMAAAEASAQLSEASRAEIYVAPEVPRQAPPTALARVVSLDMDARWWSRWFSRRNYAQEQADALRRMILDDMRPLLAELGADHRERFVDAAREGLRRFYGGFCAAAQEKGRAGVARRGDVETLLARAAKTLQDAAGDDALWRAAE